MIFDFVARNRERKESGRE